MPYIQLDDQQFALGADETLVGSREDAHIKVGGEGDGAIYAVIRREGDGTTVIRRGLTDEAVRVNGVALGIEPVPLVHGDKVDVGGRMLVFGDDPSPGRTQLLDGIRPPEGAPTSAPPRSPALSGGRLVSQVDGREYAVPPAGLVIGRDPACDIVIASSQVSRRHAAIAYADDGYVLTDTSTNGVLVNGEAVAVSRVLGRGDVIRVGEEDFRFYAQSAPTPATPPATATSLPAEAVESAPIEVEPIESAAPIASEAPIESAAPVESAVPPVLATLEVKNEGVLKGRRYEIHTPLAHIGRGAHNDVVIPDHSVSETHAKLQRRESGWVIIDIGSTNGTYVGGKRITDDQALVGEPDIRFGNVKCVFRIEGSKAAAQQPHGTRVIAPVGVTEREDTPAVMPRYAAPNARQLAEQSGGESGEGRGISGVLWVALLVAAAAVIFILTSR